MVPRVGKPASAVRAAVVCALLALLAGCGSGAQGGVSEHASADPDPPPPRTVPDTCSTAVLGALGDIAQRVYREGVASERTGSALSLIKRSVPLRTAIERDDPRAARAAAQALIATGHMTNLHVSARRPGAPRRRRTKRAGAAARQHPRRGRRPDRKLRRERVGRQRLRRRDQRDRRGPDRAATNGRSIAGSFALGQANRRRRARSTRTRRHLPLYLVRSRRPTRRAQLRVYLLSRSPRSRPCVDARRTDTVVNTLSRVARARSTRARRRPARAAQVSRVQQQPAPAERGRRARPEGDELWRSTTLLNEHSCACGSAPAGGCCPMSAARTCSRPVRAPLRLNGQTIGSFVLSIQDDEGYLRLARRLAGLDVLMYMGSPLSRKNSLGPSRAPCPPAAPTTTGGAALACSPSRRGVPLGAAADPVLIPIPYS